MTATALSPVATRFAWKEYRTLRGFWIAAFVLGVLVQWFGYAIHDRPPATDWPTAFFILALIAAALYAVGVAATTFSVEHEDETYSFLTGLPARWRPIFVGKMLYATLSTGALAAALAIVGCMMTGGKLPGLDSATFTLGAFGFIIVEALAWGTFFSLVLRQPLLAALLAIAAVSASLSILTTTFVEGNLSSLNASSYDVVLPQRLLLAAGVFLADVLLARQWLVLKHPQRCSFNNELKNDATSHCRARAWKRLRSRTRAMVVPFFGLRMFGRLAWQSCRQSWRWMLGMPTLGLMLCFILYVVTYLLRLYLLRPEDQIALGPFVFLLIIAGLYGCGVFMVDQRGQSYRFLAEHAAWPRTVWLSRLGVWLLPVAFLLLLGGIFGWSAATETQFEWQRRFVNIWRGSDWVGDRYLFQQWQEGGVFQQSIRFATWGLALGLALGQACSMFFHRALVAGLAIGVSAIPFVLLAALLLIWELSPAWFLLPIVAGLFAATWLRSPDWLTERNSPRAWSKVLLAMGLPLLCVIWLIPASRHLPSAANRIMMFQLGNTLGVTWTRPSGEFPMPIDLQPIVATWVEASELENTPAKQETVDRLQYLADSMTAGRDRITVVDSRPVSSPKQPAAEIRKLVEANRAVIEEAARLARQEYHLPLSWDVNRWENDPRRVRLWELVQLVQHAGSVATQDEQFDRALEYLLAALTLEHRLLESQLSDGSASVQQELVHWAAAEGQSVARVRHAIAALDAIYPEISDADVREKFAADGMASMADWTPPQLLMSNYLGIRDVLTGDEPSRLIHQGATWREFAMIHLNEFSFERERSLAILADIFADQTAEWYRAVRLTDQQRLQRQAAIRKAPRDARAFPDSAHELRRMLLLAIETQYMFHWPQYHSPPFSWMKTSLLLRAEFERSFAACSWLRRFVDARVRAWGLRQQLALVAYRIEHGEYPGSLDALAPDYLPFVPIDPFSGRPFKYRPRGLDLELQGIPAGTPLVWSVGAANYHLVRQTIVEPLAENPDPGVEPIDVRREVYEFRPYERYVFGSSTEVFPLPK